MGGDDKNSIRGSIFDAGEEHLPVFHGGAPDKLSKGMTEGFYVVVPDGICDFRDGQGRIYQQFTRFIDAHPLQVLFKGQPAGRLEFFTDVGQTEKVFLTDCGQRDMLSKRPMTKRFSPVWTGHGF